MVATLPPITDVPYRVWEIDESIQELAYLTHNFFRYYGKFPSVLARKLIAEFALPGHVILDASAGSGTTLVEAKLAGYHAIGVDLNPLAVLACTVKCRTYQIDELAQRWQLLSRLLDAHAAFFGTLPLTGDRIGGFTPAESRQLAAAHLPVALNLDKWFTATAQHELAIVKACLLQLPTDTYREFFVLAFCAIVRRVSRAFDGEIRPHVNRDKRARPVWSAFAKKVGEMLAREAEWVAQATNDAWSQALVADNRSLSMLPTLQHHPIGMIVAHPPYLNSFDYFPAYSLELQWSQGFPEVWAGHDLADLRARETRAWPATDGAIYEGYFAGQRALLSGAFGLLAPGGTCCFVIGDATIRKELIPVHTLCAAIAQECGFVLEEIIYRTTHYGVGKYAYSHRADYHQADGGKKDGVLILRKPG